MRNFWNRNWNHLYAYKHQRLPEQFWKYREHAEQKPQLRPHDKAAETDFMEFKKDPESGAIKRVPDWRVDSHKMIHDTPMQDLGLWGGEKILKGFVKPKRMWPKYPQVWAPQFEYTVLYSEILDKHFRIVVTDSALDQIDQNYGLDMYLLRTPDPDIDSQMGRKLKRMIILALAKKSYYPDDPKKQKEIYERYKDWVKPVEEAEWWGLEVHEAMTRQKVLEARENPNRPMKEAYSRLLLTKLDALKEAGELEDVKDEGGLITRIRKRIGLADPFS